MNRTTKLLLVPAALVGLALAVGLLRVAGIPLPEIIAGIVMSALVGVIIASYILRLGLLFLVIYALYRLLKKRLVRRSIAVPVMASSPVGADKI